MTCRLVFCCPNCTGSDICTCSIAGSELQNYILIDNLLFTVDNLVVSCTCSIVDTWVFIPLLDKCMFIGVL